MNQLHDIQRLYRVIDNSLFMVTGSLDYDRITEAVTKLANAIHGCPMSDDGYEVWTIGEGGECTLDDFLVGAYWHYTEWHGGQWSPEYRALSALGTVFNPGMTGPEDDNPAYQMLNDMAEKTFNS